MKKIVKILIPSILICFFACQKKNVRKSLSEKEIHENSIKSNLKDSLSYLFEKAIKVDTLEFDNFEPFVFFKSGHFISENEKNALIVNCQNDSTYKIELYTLNNEKWVKNDEVKNIIANRTQFHLDFKDYNFDGQKDIYIQTSASNGWSLSKGYLFTVNSSTKKMTEHKEARNLANMNPDQNNEIVFTDELDYSKNGRILNKRINKWEKDKLISLGIDKSKSTE